MKRIWALLLSIFLSLDLSASPIRWEDNVSVRKVDSKGTNQFVVVPACINLNSAEEPELLKLNGIGPKKAAAIIEYRSLHGPFKDIHELGKIKGFTGKVVAKIMEKNPKIIVGTS
ncbi:MAG: helix-hairpin-helix domain-containing protein [Gammaproteobacteria bacterium]|nr:helix-hairpin-helix domain-containing protein [Gammaproteobacteria bacterium]